MGATGNEFLVFPRKYDPDDMVRGTMGIGVNQLIDAILRNENGLMDRLSTKPAPDNGGAE